VLILGGILNADSKSLEWNPSVKENDKEPGMPVPRHSLILKQVFSLVLFILFALNQVFFKTTFLPLQSVLFITRINPNIFPIFQATCFLNYFCFLLLFEGSSNLCFITYTCFCAVRVNIVLCESHIFLAEKIFMKR